MEKCDHKLLADHPLLGTLDPDVLDDLLEDAFELTLPAGATLFQQGEEARFLRVSLSGRVALMARSEDEAETVVEFFETGDLFIIPAVVLDLPYLMSARTVEESRILMIPADAFREALERDHALALSMTRELARHWRLLTRQIKDLKLRSAPQRLGAYLLSLAEDDTAPSTQLQLPEKRRMLARRLAMTPENLSRAFGRLKELGVNSRGRHVELTDVQALRDFCAYDDLV